MSKGRRKRKRSRDHFVEALSRQLRGKYSDDILRQVLDNTEFMVEESRLRQTAFWKVVGPALEKHSRKTPCETA